MILYYIYTCRCEYVQMCVCIYNLRLYVCLCVRACWGSTSDGQMVISICSQLQMDISPSFGGDIPTYGEKFMITAIKVTAVHQEREKIPMRFPWNPVQSPSITMFLGAALITAMHFHLSLGDVASARAMLTPRPEKRAFVDEITLDSWASWIATNRKSFSGCWWFGKCWLYFCRNSWEFHNTDEVIFERGRETTNQ